MGSHLLQKEKEYHELNEKLELRTKELLHEVDNVMKLKNNLLTLDENAKINVSLYAIDRDLGDPTRPRPSKSKPQASLPKESCKIKFDPQELLELNLPEDINNMGIKGMVCFLKAKMKKMQTDYDQLSREYKIKGDEMKNAQKENQMLLDEKERWMQISLTGKGQMSKLENQISTLNSKIQTKDSEINSLQKEIDQIQKELKCSKLNMTNLEVKNHRLTEDCERVRSALKTSKQEEKDFRENHRKQIVELTTTIKRIEKHKNELLTGFKKQMLLIDNLKKQKAHIGGIKLTDKADNDFKKLLEWRTDTCLNQK